MKLEPDCTNPYAWIGYGVNEQVNVRRLLVQVCALLKRTPTCLSSLCPEFLSLPHSGQGASSSLWFADGNKVVRPARAPLGKAAAESRSLLKYLRLCLRLDTMRVSVRSWCPVLGILPLFSLLLSQRGRSFYLLSYYSPV